MTIEERLKELVVERYGNVSKFTSTIDMSNSTFVSMLNRGLRNASVTNVIKVCKELGISVDEISRGKIVPMGKKLQEKKHITELNDIVSYTRKNIHIYDSLTLDGEELTENEMYSVIDALELCVEFIRRNRERNIKSKRK